jgi:predicted dehydrogenase
MKSSPSDRREFLRASTALAMAGCFVRESGAEESQQPVRVAVVGSGARGSDLIRSLTTIERAKIIAVCDDHPPHLEQGLKYAGPDVRGFDDYSKMLHEMRPDAVVVATPLDRHFAMCVEALDAGCAVFCEKTMCHTVEEARKLADEVEKRGAVFQVGLQRRANAIYAQAQAMVETGMLGQITAIKCQWHRNNNWRRPVPVKRGDPQWTALEHRLNWRLYWDYSQGLMAELASHQLDVANRLLNATPKRVIGSGGIDYWRDGREVFDNVFCVYEYEPKVAGTLRAPSAESGRTPAIAEGAPRAPATLEPYTVRVTYSSLQNNAFEGASELVMGSKGTLFLTQRKGLFYRENGVDDPGWSRDGRVERDASIITSGKTLKMDNDPWAHRGKPYEIDSDGDDTRDELIAFLQCVQAHNPQTICDARTGYENAATVLRGNEAMREGRAIELEENAEFGLRNSE